MENDIYPKTSYLKDAALKELKRITKSIYEDECDDQVEWLTEEPLNTQEYSKKVANYIENFIPFGILKNLKR